MSKVEKGTLTVLCNRGLECTPAESKAGGGAEEQENVFLAS